MRTEPKKIKGRRVIRISPMESNTDNSLKF